MMNEAQKLKEAMKKEYIKCAVDPTYFMRKYCIIQHPQRGKVNFNLYDFQADTLEKIVSNNYTVILKARQLGLSTLTAGYALWLMTFNTDKDILVIATKQDKAKNLVTKVRVMHANLPNWLKSTCTEDNRLSMSYKNGSRIKADTSSPDAARSESLSLLILDEAAFIPKINDIWTAAQQTLSTGGRCIALSTPNGATGWFHDIWVGAENKVNSFFPIYLHWTVHPERDQVWRDKQSLDLGPELAAQECDCSFITSGKSVVPGPIIQWYLDNLKEEPIAREGLDGNYWKWKYHEIGASYVVSADVARGDGKDYSAFHVINIDTLEQVAEYQGKVDTKAFGDLCVNVATEYNDALLIIENANIGWGSIQQVVDRDYKNLFYATSDLKYVDVKSQMTNKYYRDDRKMVAGFSTTSRTRPMIVEKLVEYFRDKTAIVHSNRLINELFSFVYGPASAAQADYGANDDLVMSFAIALWVRDTAIRLRTEGMTQQKNLMKQMVDYQPVYSESSNKNDSWNWDDSHGNNVGLDWLLD